MPLVGSGFFSSAAPQQAFMLVASFIVFLVYGVLFGALAGPQATHGRKNLKNKKIAILVADGFDQTALTDSRAALEFAGAATHLTSPAGGKVKGWSGRDWGKEFPVNCPLEKADPKEFDGLLIPGGVMHTDTLRSNPAAISFVRAFFEVGKPVAAFSHGPVLLIDAGIVGGCRLTSVESVRADLKNAGAEWVDEAVVTDNGLITGRKPEDLVAFNRKVVEEFAAGPFKPRIAAQTEAPPEQTPARETEPQAKSEQKEETKKEEPSTPESANKEQEETLKNKEQEEALK
jgi:protease I